MLAIDVCEGKITLTADSRDKIKVSESTEIYNLRDLVRLDDNGEQESDCDKISEIANSWIFIEWLDTGGQCKFPKDEEEVLRPEELLKKYHKDRTALDAKIDAQLREIENLLGIKLNME